MPDRRIAWILAIGLAAVLVGVVVNHPSTTYGFGGSIHSVSCDSLVTNITGPNPRMGMDFPNAVPTTSAEVANLACGFKVDSQKNLAALVAAGLVVVVVIGLVGRRRSKRTPTSTP